MDLTEEPKTLFIFIYFTPVEFIIFKTDIRLYCGILEISKCDHDLITKSFIVGFVNFLAKNIHFSWLMGRTLV